MGQCRGVNVDNNRNKSSASCGRKNAPSVNMPEGKYHVRLEFRNLGGSQANDKGGFTTRFRQLQLADASFRDTRVGFHRDFHLMDMDYDCNDNLRFIILHHDQPPIKLPMHLHCLSMFFALWSWCKDDHMSG